MDGFKTIKSRIGDEIGKFTGSTKRCTMSSCKGTRYAVKWSDGKLTWPCSEGIVLDGQKVLKIR